MTQREELSLCSEVGCSQLRAVFRLGLLTVTSFILPTMARFLSQEAKVSLLMYTKVKRKELKAGNSGNYRDGSNSSKIKRRNSTRARILL